MASHRALHNNYPQYGDKRIHSSCDLPLRCPDPLPLPPRKPFTQQTRNTRTISVTKFVTHFRSRTALTNTHIDLGRGQRRHRGHNQNSLLLWISAAGNHRDEGYPNNRKASSTRNFHNKVTARTESKAMEYFTRCRRHHIRRIILTAIYQLFRTQYDKCTAWCAS